MALTANNACAPLCLTRRRRSYQARVRTDMAQASQPHSSPRARIAPLDGLRAIAILFVLARHGVRPFWSDTNPLFPVGQWDAGVLLINGWIGVDLFFVLSGFLITSQLCRYLDGDQTWKGMQDYAMRRLLRIAPAYYATLFIAAAGLVPCYPIVGEGLSVRVAYHVLFLQDYLPANIVVAFWSLGVEEKFYLLAPLLLLAVFRLPEGLSRYATLAALLAIPVAIRGALALRNPEIAAYDAFFPIFRSPFHASVDGLIAGTICALVYRDRQHLPWLTRIGAANSMFWAGALGVIALISGHELLAQISVFDKVILQTVLAGAFSAMVLGAALGGGPTTWLGAPWMALIARLSYSLYLVHLLIIPGVRHVLDDMVGLAEFSPAVQATVFMPVYLAVSVAVAALLYAIVEKPFLDLRDRLSRASDAFPKALIHSRP